MDLRKDIIIHKFDFAIFSTNFIGKTTIKMVKNSWGGVPRR